jgi:hypothetical protein
MRVFSALILCSALATTASAGEVTFGGLSRSNPAPTFDNGYVVGWDQAALGMMSLCAPDGYRVYETSLALPGVTGIVFLDSAAVDTDGTVAVAYHDSRWKRAGIALLDQDGKPVRFIETYPYLPSQVCFAPDHSIWMFGELFDFHPSADFKAFRKYSREGQQLGAFVPRSKLPAWEGFESDQVLGLFHGLWRFRASKDRLGAMLPIGGYKYAWVELDFSGNLIAVWKYSGTDAEAFMPAAFTASGELYANRWLWGKPAGVVVFDKATSAWKPSSSLPKNYLLGADGDRLVFKTGPDQLRWVP